MVNVCDVTNLEKKFREYLNELTLQPVELILWDTHDLLFFDPEIKCLRVNMDHPFWERFPNAFWAMRIVIDSFLGTYATLGSCANLQIVAMEQVQKRLGLRLSTLMPGVRLDLIIALSAERYESAEAKSLGLLLLPPDFPLDLPELQQNIVFFDADQRLELASRNIHALRKQLNMARDGCLVMGFCEGERLVCSLGVGRKDLLKWCPYLLFQGHTTWSYCIPPVHPEAGDDGCRLSYCRGRLMLPRLDLSQTEKVCMLHATRNACRTEVLERVLAFAKGQRKGTIIVLSTKEFARQESDRLCRQYNRGILLEHPYPLLDSTYQPIIQELTAIDGALLVDMEGNCWACGVILDGKAMEKGNMARGARYNSALNYTRVCKNDFPDNPVAVIVASEDGMLDILSNED